MNLTIKDAAVKRFHHDSRLQLEKHLNDFISANNFGWRLKALKGFAPFEFICKQWTNEPERFKFNPLHNVPGLNSLKVQEVAATAHG